MPKTMNKKLSSPPAPASKCPICKARLEKVKQFLQAKFGWLFRGQQKRRTIIILSILAVIFLSWLFFRAIPVAYREHQERAAARKLQNQLKQYTLHYQQDGFNPTTPGLLNLQEKFKKSSDLVDPGMKIIKVNASGDLNKTIADAAVGAVIMLDSGEYKMNLNINNKDLTIIGQGEKTILTKGKTNNAAITINGGKVALKNLVIKNVRIGINAVKTDLSLSYVKINNIEATALYLEDGQLSLMNTTIANSGTGLKMKNSRGNITDSLVKENNDSGAILYNSNCVLSGNNISNNKSYGLFIDSSSEARLTKNYIGDNKGYNIRVEKSGDLYR